MSALRQLRGRIAFLAAIALVALGAIVVSPTTAQAAGDEATFVGHGYGHGRGMGQYGAYGYAVNFGWTYDGILARYYGGTTLATNAGNPTLTVELTRVIGGDTIVTGSGLAINGVAVGAAAALIRRTGSGTFRAYAAPGCGGPVWSPWGGALGSGLTISTSGDQSNLSNLVVVCEPTKSTGYRGTLKVVEGAGQQYVLNVVGAQDYLRGVVPRESPASWGYAGGGRGMEALKAQAVAARSYALGSARRSASGASTCDSQSCQVYGGAFEQPYGGTFKTLEEVNSNAAVLATSGQVMRAANGSIARTEFSSSTGGWTAGGTFPAVEDAGDATRINPNHTWSTSISLAAVAAALGTGQIRSISVTQRNGLGADGGRAMAVSVTEVGGRTTSFSGDTVRLKLGLKSNWFSVSALSRPAVEAVVKALYQDVLGRAPDPQGLANWTNIVFTTGRPKLVADGIVNSPERLAALVAAEYVPAVHRSPEPGGLASWVRYLEGGATVSDLQIGVYGSPESLAVLGGGDLRSWVAGMYAAILGRPASSGETAVWAQVATTSGRTAAVAGIARSLEAGNRRLEGYYLRFLGRGLDPSGRASWLPSMSGRGDFTVPGMIGGSVEYWDRAQLRFG